MALTDNLEAYYRFDGSLADASGHTRTITGPAAYGAGILGQALSSSTGASVANFLTGGVVSGAYTISVWLRFDGDGHGLMTLQILDLPDAHNVDLNLQIVGIDISCEWLNGSVVLATNTAIAADAWHHFVLVVDAGTLRLYIDGVLDTSVNSALTTTFTPGTSMQLTVNPINDGARADELGIWSRALSPAEIATLYNNGAAFDPTSVPPPRHVDAIDFPRLHTDVVGFVSPVRDAADFAFRARDAGAFVRTGTDAANFSFRHVDAVNFLES